MSFLLTTPTHKADGDPFATVCSRCGAAVVPTGNEETDGMCDGCLDRDAEAWATVDWDDPDVQREMEDRRRAAEYAAGGWHGGDLTFDNEPDW